MTAREALPPMTDDEIANARARADGTPREVHTAWIVDVAVRALDDLTSKRAEVDAAYEALQGRIGRDGNKKGETVLHACDEYALAENELTDEFDSEDYSLSKAVRAMRRALEAERQRSAMLEYAFRASRRQEEYALHGIARYARVADAAKAFADAQVRQFGDHPSERTEEENALHREVKRLADAPIVVTQAPIAERDGG